MNQAPILAKSLLRLLQSTNGGYVSEEMIVAVVWQGRSAPPDVWLSVRGSMGPTLRNVYGARIETHAAAGTRFYRLAPEVV